MQQEKKKPIEISQSEMFYQKQVMNPYSTGGQSYTAYEKGFVECFNLFFASPHPGAVWVKASNRQPINNNLVHLNYSTGKTDFKTTGYYEPSEKKWYNQNRTPLDWAPNLIWLDENESPSKEGNKEREDKEFIEWLRVYYGDYSNKTTEQLYEQYNQQKEGMK